MGRKRNDEYNNRRPDMANRMGPTCATSVVLMAEKAKRMEFGLQEGITKRTTDSRNFYANCVSALPVSLTHSCDGVKGRKDWSKRGKR